MTARVVSVVQTSPTFLTAGSYEQMAGDARRRGLPKLERFFVLRAHVAQVNEERAVRTAREVIADARLAAALEFLALDDMEAA